MRRRRPEFPQTWIMDPDPMVPEPTVTGRTVLRMWFEEQLRLFMERRRRHRRR